ncbi:MAG: PBP1A family penicillin-binding protein [Hyphomicrobiales bacterium]|nr:PBP1A family penicillin-binding protein [Hyphomicrobiales bacterium]MCP5370125.1 PBP1A family penicillin-binding protein [Hyphomicrobiales bacterium]
MAKASEPRNRTGTKKKASAKAAPRKPAPKRDVSFDAGRDLRRRVLRFTAKWTAVAAIWTVIAVGAVVAWYGTDLPDVDEALAATRRPTVTLLAADGTVLAARGDLYGQPVRLDGVPPALPAAILATEDRRFYNHFGIDLIGLARAMARNVAARRIVQGGSTITQQVAKNLFLSHDRTFRRKIQEVLLALWLEHRFSKDQILTLYLNRVYLGAGVYGVDAAARRYFGRPAAGLDTYQSAVLAGLLKAPSRYNPRANPDLAKARTAVVLANLVAVGYMTEAEAAQIRAAGEKAVAVRASRRRSGRYFVDWILEQTPDYVPAGDRDVTVVTTLDSRLQAKAEGLIAAALAGPGRKAGVGQAAAVVMEPDGAVRALVGGGDYDDSQFNRATQARRQPGSAFKPIVFLAGLEAGLTPDSVLEDAPVAVGDWRPRNFDGKYHGRVTLRQALAQSLNTVSVRVARKAGAGRILKTARRLGITSSLPGDLSLALGAGEVSLLELTAAYAPFANGGLGVWPYGIEEIRDGRGKVLYRRTGSGPGRVMTADQAAQMTDMMRAVIAEGTGRGADPGRPAAGKTGTSQEFRDAWFMGYAGSLVAGVWMGNDDDRPMQRVSGGGLPARLWRDIMGAALRGRP